MPALRNAVRPVALLAATVVGAAPLAGQATTAARPHRASTDVTRTHRDLTTQPTLYTVGYAHLDTEWRWEYPQVISEYLPNTMHDNFALFEKYPAYVFNFSGANRYRLMKEYWPQDYARMAAYIKAGRWFPAGSSMEEGDVNAPSAEAILRQFLYGNEYFQKEFGVTSKEFMLPDCFGFPWSLPELLAHAGLKGFSTQKLVWGSSVPDQPTTPYGESGQGIPFNVGVWVGPDGSSVVAALNPGTYSGSVRDDLATATALDNRPTGRGAQAQTFLARLTEDKAKLGIMADYHYYGTGDVGGSPTDSSVMWIQRSVDDTAGPIKVISSRADQFFLDLTPTEIARLPRYSGEMELQNHSAGSLTSEAYQKRWIRQNEILADAAEKASIAAQWLGGPAYPSARLDNAWTLMLGDHFHDIAAGTATPKAYEFAWNDDVIAMNTLADVITSGTSSVASALNTDVAGTPVVVYNPLNIARTDLVTATVPATGNPDAVVVHDQRGAAVPADLVAHTDTSATITFVAHVPSVGFAVYGVNTAAAPVAPATELHVDDRSLENARYKVRIDDDGDIASVFDKKINRELLSAPIRLALLHDDPAQWPAWNMDFADEQAAPRGYVSGPATIRVTERGPARVAITIDRSVDSSHFEQTVSLAAGDAGNRVDVANVIDWRMPATALKATFPFTASDSVATYNWDVGTMKRGNEYDRKFEVPSHQWIDLTDRSGTFGTTILTDDKNGSDKLNDNTIRLTLIRTPGSRGGYTDQASQDFGHHEFRYGIAGHSGDFRTGQTDWQGWRLNTPMMAFATTRHAGRAGSELSLLKVSDPRVRVMALKKAEASNELIVRIVELDGKAHSNVQLSFAGPVTAAREVNGQEQPVGAATVRGGALVTSLKPFAIRSFAVTVAPAAARIVPQRSAPVALTYDRSVTSRDGQHSAGGFAADGSALPAEMLPASLDYDGVRFHLGPTSGAGSLDAVTAMGQTIALPAGNWTRVYVLAASDDGDQTATFRAGDLSRTFDIENWGGYVGQWDYRTMKRIPGPQPTPQQLAAQATAQRRADSVRRVRIDSVLKAGGDTSKVPRGRGRGNQGPRMIDAMDHLNPGFIKPADIAWFASHHHDAAGANQFYSYSYLFAYPIDIPAGTRSITLPDNDRIRVMAMTVANPASTVRRAAPLYDTLGRTAP